MVTDVHDANFPCGHVYDDRKVPRTGTGVYKVILPRLPVQLSLSTVRSGRLIAKPRGPSAPHCYARVSLPLAEQFTPLMLAC